jgi:hypothetical protein
MSGYTSWRILGESALPGMALPCLDHQFCEQLMFGEVHHLARSAHGSLDDPESVKPRAHQWTDSALSWLTIDDELPRFSDGRRSHADKR